VTTSSSNLTGCANDYWTRSDSIYLSHGDAVRSNAAVQIPDPWPARSADTNIPMDPVKATRAMDCYRIGQKPADQLGAYSSSFSSAFANDSGKENKNNCDYSGRGSTNGSPVNNGTTPPGNTFEMRGDAPAMMEMRSKQ
jgi:hypothetical protein